MDCIAAVDQNWGIGKDGGMLFRLPGDLQYFRKITLGHPVLMGRATLESLPGGRPLPRRENFVLSRDPAYVVPGARVVHSPKEARAALADRPDVFVIGGGEAYRLFLPDCRSAYITHIEAAAPADRFFPNLAVDPAWAVGWKSEPQEENGVRYRWVRYDRVEELR